MKLILFKSKSLDSKTKTSAGYHLVSFSGRNHFPLFCIPLSWLISKRLKYYIRIWQIDIPLFGLKWPRFSDEKLQKLLNYKIDKISHSENGLSN